jgi:hypothetical protein
MTDFHDTLIAISHTGTRYQMAGKAKASLDWAALARDGLLLGVTDVLEFPDEAAILHRTQVPIYLKAVADPGRKAVEDWLGGLPQDVKLVLYHRVACKEGLTD